MVAAMSKVTYTIKATPVAHGGWTLVVDGVGVSFVRRLDQAEDEMRSAVMDLTGQAADQIEMRVEPELPADLVDQINQVGALHADAERLAEQARAGRRALARDLHERWKLPVRDVGEIMNLSHQRVSQLLK